MQPLTLPEVLDQIKDVEEKQELYEHLQHFTSIKAEDAKKLSQELKDLNNLKMKDEYLVKLVDFLPKDAEDVHKIFTDVSLDDSEVQAILGILENYRK